MLALTFACGGSGGGSSSKNTIIQEEQVDNDIRPGKYVAFIRPINTRVYGLINSGRADISVDKNLTVKLIMDDAPGVTHIQSIQTGTECPRMENDTNRDGYIDTDEAEATAGQMLIPLDDNIEVQLDGRRVFPAGKSYTFNRTGSVQKIIKDLNSSFTLDGKVILIYGAYESANLPASVASIDGLTRAQSIPIACGKIMALNDAQRSQLP